MKRYRVYILTSAVLLLAACSDGDNGYNEPIIKQPVSGGQINTIPSDNKYPIEFTASMDEEAETRAITITYPNTTNVVYGLKETGSPATVTDFHDGIEDNADLKQTGIGVYAYYTGDTDISDDNNDGITEQTIANPWERQIVMKNQKVEYNPEKDIWKYNSLHYWPENDKKMSFFAYAPHSSGVDLINSPTTTAQDASGYYYFTDKVRIPIKNWKIEDQEDLIWGYSSETKLSYKNVTRLDTDGGKLHWLFKHALARVQFSIFNFLDILDAYGDVVTGIPPGQVVTNYITGADAYVGAFGAPQARYYPGSGSDDPLQGFYVNLFELSDGQHIWHKFEDLGRRARLLIITGVTFKNLITDATLIYDNTTETVDDEIIAVPNWVINEKSDTEHLYSVPESVLNPVLFKRESEFASIDFDGAWDSYPSVDVGTLPLTTPGNDTSKSHFFLMVPNTENIEITVHYRIISRYSINGTYDWDGTNSDVPDPQTESYAFEMKGVTGTRVGEDFSISASIDKLFEPNHSYHVSIRLGKMMQVLFEVTDWDDTDGQHITIPSFE